MKYLGLAVFIILILLVLPDFKLISPNRSDDYDVYQYIKECKDELGIQDDLPVLSCLDGKPVPVYVHQQEINGNNWHKLSGSRQCDNPHWLGGAIGCWTYSHLQVIQLDKNNVMVVNCRQKGGQDNKSWYRNSDSNLGLNQQQRKQAVIQASASDKNELYSLYNTFNDLGIILRNTKTGKSCYLTQFGQAFSGYIPPLDKPLPPKKSFFKYYNPDILPPPQSFPENLWYRDANKAFKTPAETAQSGCINCHNAHGFKYSPYINSKQGLPSIYDMAKLPFLVVGYPFKEHFRKENFLQLTTAPIDGKEQLCTSCHKMTTAGTCGYNFDFAIGHPNMTLHQWLTTGNKTNWMPPIKVDAKTLYRHIQAMDCCCKNPNAKGCLTRKIGPTEDDLPEGFAQGKGWVKSTGPGECIR